MRILFVYSTTKTITPHKPLRGQEDVYLGISYISSILKINGHQTTLVVLDCKNTKRNSEIIDNRITAFTPDIICFTSVFSEFDFINSIASYIKRKYPSLFTVIGGVHVSINPKEEYLNIYDTICIGEGEYPILELVNRIQKNERFTDLPNFWFKAASSIIKNPPRPFIDNISELPLPDRDIWQEWILKPSSRFTVLLGRGCPFNCTYCCNHKIREIASGKYVRLRDVQDIINELNELSMKFPYVTDFFLEVETCGFDIDWLINLCDSLSCFNRQFKTPRTFATNLRVFPGIKDEVVFQSLKKANFIAVSIGLESGNERVRQDILNRNYSNNDIRRVIATARKYGIMIGLYNMVGLPGESYLDFKDTLRFNQELQPDRHATSIFFPYEGTELYKKAIDFVKPESAIKLNNERQKARLDFPGFSKKQIQRAFDSFHFDVYKKAKNRNPFLLFVYFVQKYVGHNFMAEVKVRMIRFLSFFNS